MDSLNAQRKSEQCSSCKFDGFINSKFMEQLDKKSLRIGAVTNSIIMNLWSKIYANLFLKFESISLKEMECLYFYMEQSKLISNNFNGILVRCRSLALQNARSHEFESKQDAIFRYKKWHLFFPTENIPPKLEYFKSLERSEKNLSTIIKFYERYEPVVIGDSVIISTSLPNYDNLIMFGGAELIPTFQSKRCIDFIVTKSNIWWPDLEISNRICIWSLLIGFMDILKSIPHSIRKTTNCENYITMEVEASRLIKITTELPHQGKILCPKYFSITEQKVSQVKNLSYQKIRHVCDCTLTNKFLLEPASNMAYTFKTAESLFSDLELFKTLMKSTHATITDKSDYYRHILIIPSRLAYVWDDKFYYADTALKMGHAYSSAFAQLVSNWLDDLWNFTHSNLYTSNQDSFSTSVSLLDDTVYLQRNSSVSLIELVEHNENYGFKINQLKTVRNRQKFTWSGYEFNLISQTVKLPEKKISNIRKLIEDVVEGNIARRLVASLLGKIFSARLCAFGNSINFASLTLETRKFMFTNATLFANQLEELKFKWFYKDCIKEKYKAFFDELLPKTTAMQKKILRNELEVSFEICASEVDFKNIRRNIFSLNEFYTLQRPNTEPNFLFVDASDKQYGAHVRIFNNLKWKHYALAGKFNNSEIKKSINIKEFYILLVGICFCIYINNIEHLTADYIVFTDNETARWLAVSKKATIRSPDLAKMSKILSFILLSSVSVFHFSRISTSDNLTADFLSRDEGVTTYVAGSLGFSIEELLGWLD